MLSVQVSPATNTTSSQDINDTKKTVIIPMNEDSIVAQLRDKQLLVVNPKKKNGLIIYKRYHAEFAGPGAVVGSYFDLDVVGVLAVGNLSLICPKTSQDRVSAYLLRRQWIRLLKQITDNPEPLQRAETIINQFRNWFDEETSEKLPNEAFARLVGVLPETVRRAREGN